MQCLRSLQAPAHWWVVPPAWRRSQGRRSGPCAGVAGGGRFSRPAAARVSLSQSVSRYWVAAAVVAQRHRRRRRPMGPCAARSRRAPPVPRLRRRRQRRGADGWLRPLHRFGAAALSPACGLGPLARGEPALAPSGSFLPGCYCRYYEAASTPYPPAAAVAAAAIELPIHTHQRRHTSCCNRWASTCPTSKR
jgi:hypothetical protein